MTTDGILRRSTLGWFAAPVVESAGRHLVADALRTYLLRECNAMARHAFGSGLKMPAALIESLDRIDAETKAPGLSLPSDAPTLIEVARLHNRLAEVVAPALPQTICLLHEERARAGWWSFLGPLPTLRRIMLAMILFTGVFIGTCLSPDINPDSVAEGLLNAAGLKLLVVLIFMISAAGMGACFQALFTAHRYISAGTYDARYESSYWIRVALGLVAGLMMAELVPIGDSQGKGMLVKPMLALLGGFSSSLVYRVLARLVDTVESLFKGDPREVLEALEQADRARRASEAAHSRIEITSYLLALREEIARGATPEQLAQIVGQTIHSFAPNTGPPLAPEVVPPQPAGDRSSAMRLSAGSPS